MGVVLLASTGDNPGTEYPSVSPNVVAAGGATGAPQSLHWRSYRAGGLAGRRFGPSISMSPVLLIKTGSKAPFRYLREAQRGVPDLSFDSDTNTGVWIYDSFPMADFPDAGVDGSNRTSSAVLVRLSLAGRHHQYRRSFCRFIGAGTSPEYTTTYLRSARTFATSPRATAVRTTVSGRNGLGLLHRCRYSRGIRRQVGTSCPAIATI